jgi:hypothetical protein
LTNEDLRKLDASSIDGGRVHFDGVGSDRLVATADFACWKWGLMGLVHFRSGFDISRVLCSRMESVLDNMSGDVEQVWTEDVAITSQGGVLYGAVHHKVFMEWDGLEILEEVEVNFVLHFEVLVLPIEMKGRVRESFAPVGSILVPVRFVGESTIQGIVSKGTLAVRMT